MSSLGSKTSTKQNLFQKKRRLQKTIDKTKAEFEKGSKEVAALQLMVATYKERPEYGSAARFEQELRLAEEKVTITTLVLIPDTDIDIGTESLLLLTR